MFVLVMRSGRRMADLFRNAKSGVVEAVTKPQWEESHKQVRLAISDGATDLTQLDPALGRACEQVNQRLESENRCVDCREL
jgi:hypothetical protein